VPNVFKKEEEKEAEPKGTFKTPTPFVG